MPLQPRGAICPDRLSPFVLILSKDLAGCAGLE